MANQFKLAEAFTEFTIKGWTQFKARMMGAKRLAISALAPFRLLGGMIRKVFSPLGIGLGGLAAGAGILGLLKLSSAAKETKAAFDSIFRESADDANAWVHDMATAFDRNETNLREALLRFQSLFRGFGASTEDSFVLAANALQAAMDIEAFRNLPPGAAIDKVTSGLAGMMRPLLDIGINVQQGALDAELMAQGFAKGSQNVDRLTKSVVALKVINDTTRRLGIVGQAGRELTGFAAQFRSMMESLQTLGERIGALLVPVFKEVAFLANAIASVMGRVAKEILPTVVAFMAPLTSMLHSLAVGLQGVDVNTLMADLGKIIVQTMALFRELFLLTMTAGGKILVVWAKVAGEAFSDSIVKGAKNRVSTLPFEIAQLVGIADLGLDGVPRSSKTGREAIAAGTTLGIAKDALDAANKLASDFGENMLKAIGAGGDDAGRNAKDITDANINAGRALIDSMLNVLKGGAAAGGAGGPSFFAVGFSALQKHLQSQVSKGAEKQIQLLEAGNVQRKEMIDIIKGDPPPAPVGA